MTAFVLELESEGRKQLGHRERLKIAFLLEILFDKWYSALDMSSSVAQAGCKKLISQASDFYAVYSTERLRVRAEHLLGAASRFDSPRLLMLAEAALLALSWKNSLPIQAEIH